jgi:hypothetical protein
MEVGNAVGTITVLKNPSPTTPLPSHNDMSVQRSAQHVQSTTYADKLDTYRAVQNSPASVVGYSAVQNSPASVVGYRAVQRSTGKHSAPHTWINGNRSSTAIVFFSRSSLARPSAVWPVDVGGVGVGVEAGVDQNSSGRLQLCTNSRRGTYQHNHRL